MLKVAAPPQTIESVLSTFLPRYAQRFPNVHVKLTEALGREQTAMLERGEVHVGIRHDQCPNRRFESRALPPDEVLAACAPSLQLGHAGTDRYRPARVLSVAVAGLGLFSSEAVRRSLPSHRCRAQYSAREPRAAHLARARGGRARGSDHSVAPANGSLHIENRPRNTPAQAASRAICHSVGQAASNAALCRELLRGARRVYARGPPDHASVGKQDGRRTETTCCPKISQAHRPRLKGLLRVFRVVSATSATSPLCPQLRTYRGSAANGRNGPRPCENSTSAMILQ